VREKKRTGILLAFEGIDGGGKTTQAKLLQQHLLKLELDVVYSFEPTDGQYGRRIRQGLLEHQRFSPEEELELFRLDRLEHVKTLIQPALSRGAVVIVDRYYYSSMAYQGSRNYKTPHEIHDLMTAFAPTPDLTLIFEVNLDTALSRIINVRNDLPNLMEKRENLAHVKAVFDQINLPEIVRIDSSPDVDQVFDAVKQVVLPLLQKKFPVIRN